MSRFDYVFYFTKIYLLFTFRCPAIRGGIVPGQDPDQDQDQDQIQLELESIEIIQGPDLDPDPILMRGIRRNV